MKKLKLIFAGILAILLFTGTASALTTDVPGTIGNLGTWATPHNQSIIINNLGEDLNAFGQQFQNAVTTPDYIPIEARVGRAVIGALERVGMIMERSLFNFISVFIIVMLVFWIALEGYNFAQSGGGDAVGLAKKIALKVMLCGIWIWVISHNPAQMFMYLMGPVISVGSYFSDLILNSVTSSAGIGIPDSCAAIHRYVAASPSVTSLIPGDALANILCVPTRLSGFFYTCVSAGLQWMRAGIGTSAMTFFVGLAFVVLFTLNIWKFAFMALGVVVKLFLSLLFLPLTAIAETVARDGASGKTIASDIFGKFAGLFQTVSLSAQLQRFVEAVIYFICLSVIIAVTSALLSGVVATDLATDVPTIDATGFVTVFLCGCLVLYLANQASNLAKELGGAAQPDDSFGRAVQGDIKTLWDGTKKNAAQIWKALRK